MAHEGARQLIEFLSDMGTALEVTPLAHSTGVSPPGPPEITVSMPARNVARFIKPAIWSVLLQEDIEVALVVVDDGSTDGTAEVAESIGDPRLSVLRNGKTLGIGFCHNRVLELADTPFLAHVDADDFIVPWALRKMVDALSSCPEAGQAYCNHIVVGAHGSVPRKEFDEQVRFLESQRSLHPDCRRGLLVHGMVANTLRTYPRSVFEQVGTFNERLKYAVDYEMAVRIADARDMVYVPDFLYCQRVHSGNTQQTMCLRNLRSCLTRTRICLRLMTEGGELFLRRRPREVIPLLTLGLFHALRITSFLKALRRFPTLAWKHTRSRMG